jgi:Cysteine-rich VLP
MFKIFKVVIEIDIKRKVQSLVKDACANYDADGLCLLETGPDGCRVCRYFRANGHERNRCRYFETAVLPADPALENEYRRELDALSSIVATTPTHRCARCGDPFVKRSNRAKYCDDCRRLAHRDQKREHARKRRAM